MPLRKILLLLDSQHYGRIITGGILMHTRSNLDWRCHVEGWGERTDWDVGTLRTFDGIIALVRTTMQAERLAAANRPVVNVSNFGPGSQFPSVLNDDGEVGRMGARWLLARGWRTCAFIGSSSVPFVTEREAGFTEAVANAGGQVHRFSSKTGGPVAAPVGLAHFIADLPRPIAVMAANDYLARQVALNARDLNISMPNQLALLGVDDDALVCELTSPPLASIAIDGAAIGKAAGDLLDRLLAGEPPPPAPLRIPPLRVVPRLSADAIAVTDPDLSTAWSCIRAHALEGISVEDVVAAVPLSRSVLEKRFQQVFGTSIGVELRRYRMDEARRLLSLTDMPLGRLARACGYSNAKQLGAAFVREFGETMSAWRERHRPR